MPFIKLMCLVQAVAERNSAEGRAQRSAAAQMKVKADLAQLEIKLQVLRLQCAAVSLLTNVSQQRCDMLTPLVTTSLLQFRHLSSISPEQFLC